METHFASADRSDEPVIRQQVAAIAGHPVVTTLLRTLGGLLGVLNERRQLLALNESYLAFLGVDDPARVLGLRPGEAVGCIHENEMPGGCGTSHGCGSCGMAIALVASLDTGRPSDATCALAVARDGVRRDIYLRVRCSPLELDGQRLILLFLDDVTVEQQHAVLQRVFFHDATNLIQALVGSSELVVAGDAAIRDESAQQVRSLSLQLSREVDVQRALVQGRSADLRPSLSQVDIGGLLQAVRDTFVHHHGAAGKTVAVSLLAQDLELRTDRDLVFRVLSNMVLNALEASEPGDEVLVSTSRADHTLTFSVWNARPIPPAVASRIFQRNFSTKGGLGRGLGTFSMKLFGERALGGRVTFSSSAEAGTTFSLSLPA